jgi:ketosteroid isomerase-like protein
MRSSSVAELAFVMMVLAIPPSTQAADRSEAELIESLTEAETTFATSVREKDWESFVEHIDPNAVFIGGQVLEGKDAILKSWKVYFADNAPRLEWRPEEVVVRPDGVLGITRGPYTLRFQSESGEEVTQAGRFSSIWERQGDGRWRVLFDSGCPPCATCD